MEDGVGRTREVKMEEGASECVEMDGGPEQEETAGGPPEPSQD